MKESKAYQEIMEEGRVEATRANVLEAIEVRFGAQAALEFQDALRGINDLEQLSYLFRLAIQSRRLTELRRALAATIKS